MRTSPPVRRRRVRRPGLAVLVAALAATVAPRLGAQRPTAERVAGSARWTVVAPEAPVAWYDLLADVAVPGAGAFRFTAARPGAPADRALASALATTRESEVLHFVPLYHPSADRAALVEAMRTAAGESAPAPRATLLTAALRGALSPETRRAWLPALADALARAGTASPRTAGGAAGIPGAEVLARWQRALDSLYLPALSPWLVLERLDAGRLIVAPGIGAEGRLFAATQDRDDNLAAVGDFATDADAEAPLLAFVREVCFPAVSRAARSAGLDASDPGSARRSSLSAVRCGAALMDARLPERAVAYRAFWLRRRNDSSTPALAPVDVPRDAAALRRAFDEAFPVDAAFGGALTRAIARLPEVR
jgi:hypothetical protein